jgi:hypothetical protein
VGECCYSGVEKKQDRNFKGRSAMAQLKWNIKKEAFAAKLQEMEIALDAM